MRLFSEKSVVIFFVIISAIVLAFSVRGLAGNPVATELDTPQWSFDGPLELSPERGRYALLYSLIENHSLFFEVNVARLAIPDLAINTAGQYVSLFAPGVSFLVVPGYIIGKYFGAAQVGTFAVIAFFALANVLLIVLIARTLGAKRLPALLGAATFLFATPAFTYATTLYQHHVSVFLLLVALLTVIRSRSLWSFAFVWFLCVTAVVVDNPNVFLMFPVGLLTLIRLGQYVTERATLPVYGKKLALGLMTFLVIIPPTFFFLWYNTATVGNPFQLPGTLKSVAEIDADGKPVDGLSTYEKSILTEEQLRSLEENNNQNKSAVGFFNTRNLYNGFFVHFLSPDRGILVFTPVILLGIIGLVFLYRRQQRVTGLIIATIGSNILLYSLWGDPWGGWAFGSRYLIPTYALLAIGLAVALSVWGKRLWFVSLFFLLFAYSSGVNTLGALTSSANPLEIQVLSLEAQTGHEQKYTYVRNWEFLHQKYEHIGSKAFVYQAFASRSLTAPQYFVCVYGMILLLVVTLLLGTYFIDNKNLRL